MRQAADVTSGPAPAPASTAMDRVGRDSGTRVELPSRDPLEDPLAAEVPRRQSRLLLDECAQARVFAGRQRAVEDPLEKILHVRGSAQLAVPDLEGCFR